MNAAAPAEGEPYGRTLVHADAAHEMILMRWRPDSACAPHDHGAASGVIHLLDGVFTERVYARDGAQLRVVAERTFAAPHVVTIPAGHLHDMRCDRAGASLHIYRPRIAAMRVYDLARREILTVSDDCGAWIPRDPALILGREPGPGA